MTEKHIRKNRKSYTIYKGSKTYGRYMNLDDAITARDILTSHDWDMTRIPNVIQIDDGYLILTVTDDKLHITARTATQPSDDLVEKLIKRQRRNPNNSRYGLNITRVFDTFIIQKTIRGDEYIFGYYDNLEDASFVRNHLLDNNWDTGTFSKIMHDDETGKIKITDVIDGKVYVLDTYDDENDVSLEQSYNNFLVKITKHNHGLASHPYLDELTGMVSELEEKYNVKAHDDVWDLSNVANPLEDVIFKLTPFQKIVYDNVDGTTLEEIEARLAGYRSGNFTMKIKRNLDELVELDLIAKKGEVYSKR